MKRLLATHRETDRKLNPCNAKMFDKQLVLRPHIVISSHQGESWSVIRRVTGARRGRQAVGEHVGNDNEVALRVESTTRTNEYFVRRVAPSGPSRVDNHIVVGIVQFTVCRIRELGIR